MHSNAEVPVVGEAAGESRCTATRLPLKRSRRRLMLIEARLRATPGDTEVPWCSRPGSVVAKALASGCSPSLIPAQRGGLTAGGLLP